jgi:hypothetical protein
MYPLEKNLRLLVNRNIFLYNLLNHKSLASSNIEICLEAFPRSGNSFAHRFLTSVKDIKIAHHTHSVANLKSSIRNNIPTFVLIRNPIDTIASFTLMQLETTNRNIVESIGYSIEYYRQFYQYVLENRDKITLIDFNELTKNPKKFLEIIESHSNVELPELDDSEIEKKVNEAISRIDEGFKKGRRKYPAIPEKERDKKKDEIKTYAKEQFGNRLHALNELYSSLSPKNHSPDTK